MKKEYIKPIIEYCHSDTTTIMAGSLHSTTEIVDDSGANPNNPNTQKDGVHAPAESKDNFWNLWEDDDMEFEF